MDSPLHLRDKITVQTIGGSAIKKEKTVSLAGKVIETIFWNSQDVVLIDFL